MSHTRFYVSTIEASYFDEHQLCCLDSPPKVGRYNIGDIIISSKQEKDIIGWICVESGRAWSMGSNV